MIEVKDLHKKFDKISALNGVSFSVVEGEIFGLLGPNGAGKSTTLNILSTIIRPDKGSVAIGGCSPAENLRQYKKLIGVVPQEIALYEELTAEENLLFWGSLYDLDSTTLRKRAAELLDLVGLSDRRKDKVSTFSGGMKRRINIASALLHTPKVLFLDEPTVGIDPQSRNRIFEVIEKLHAGGITMIYTTHYMEEAERLCDRIGIIDAGRILAQGTLEELRKSSPLRESLQITLFNEPSPEIMETAQGQFGSEYSLQGNTLHFTPEDIQESLSPIISALTQAGARIRNVHIEKANLESIFLDLTGKKLRD